MSAPPRARQSQLQWPRLDAPGARGWLGAQNISAPPLAHGRAARNSNGSGLKHLAVWGGLGARNISAPPRVRLSQLQWPRTDAPGVWGGWAHEISPRPPKGAALATPIAQKWLGARNISAPPKARRWQLQWVAGRMKYILDPRPRIGAPGARRLLRTGGAQMIPPRPDGGKARNPKRPRIMSAGLSQNGAASASHRHLHRRRHRHRRVIVNVEPSSSCFLSRPS